MQQQQLQSPRLGIAETKFFSELQASSFPTQAARPSELTGTHILIHSECFIFYVCSHSEDSEQERNCFLSQHFFNLKN